VFCQSGPAATKSCSSAGLFVLVLVLEQRWFSPAFVACRQLCLSGEQDYSRNNQIEDEGDEYDEYENEPLRC